MFTGIVTEMGTVVDSTPTGTGRSLVVAAAETSSTLHVGDSVAINGVCLTAVDVAGPRFTVDVVPETLARTGLGALAVGDQVNLERPLAAAGRFDGHIVQGHVDGVGEVLGVDAEGGSARMTISLPESLSRYVVEKGSITVDGVSLTVTEVSPPSDSSGFFSIALIPHTLAVTVLGMRRPGDVVNLEVDLVAKYVERMLEGSR